jgi:hypothetical protein
MAIQSTRRTLLGGSLLAGAFSAIVEQPSQALSHRVIRQDTTATVGEGRSPGWVCVVHTVQDPYDVTRLVRPEEPETGMRYVAADIEIRNEIDEPLNFTVYSIYFLSEDGLEHAVGSAAGDEPLLPSFNMSPGDRVRGWVWSAVPEDARLSEVAYYGPPPRVTIALPDAG